MRAAVILFLVAAGIGDTVPGLFLSLVNNAIKGRIDPRVIRYDAPSSVILEDAVLTDPNGAPVAKVKRATATVSLKSLIAGEIVISKIEIDEPKLILEVKDKKLNLIEALTPKKPPDKSKPPEAAFRIDSIVARNGGFRFTDNQNVTVTADGLHASASLEVDLVRELVLLDVREPRVDSASVKLPELDVPLNNIRARSVRILKDKLELTGVTGKAAGASVSAYGSIVLKEPGHLSIHGNVDAPANAWPERLKRPPFETPAITAAVDVTGPFDNPTVKADGAFGKASAFEYTIESGRGVVEVTKARVKLLPGTQVRAGGGSARVTGTIRLPELDLDLEAQATDVSLAKALEPAKPPQRPQGSVTARAKITGRADGKGAIVVDVKGTARRAELYSVKLPESAELQAKLVVQPKKTTLESATVDAPGLNASVRGDIHTEEQRLALRVSASGQNVTALVPSVPPEVRAAEASFEGTITGPYKTVKVDGAASIPRGTAYGVPLSGLKAHVVASANDVAIFDLAGRAADGAVTLQEPLRINLVNKTIRGRARVDRVALHKIKAPDGAELPIAGTGVAEAQLSGPVENPTVSFQAAVGGFRVKDEELGAVTATGQATKAALLVRSLDVDGPLLEATSKDALLTIETLQIVANVDIKRLDLARIKAAEQARLSGVASGTAWITGDVRAPTVSAPVQASFVQVGEARLGSGPVVVGLLPDGPALAPPKRGEKPKAPRGHIARAAVRLASDNGVIDGQVSFAIQRKVLNAHVDVQDVDLSAFTARLGEHVAPLEGFASGTIEASGPLEALSGRVRARVPELAVARTVTTDEGEVQTLPSLRPLGSLVVDARMDAGDLSARICGFPGGALDPDAPCSAGERLWANVVGQLDIINGAFDLGIDGKVDERHLEDLLPAVSKRGFKAGATARLSAQIGKQPDKPVDVRAAATLLGATVEATGSLASSLVGTSELVWSENRLTFVTPARFKAPSGEVDVVIAGSVGTQDIALDVDGAAALALAKLFTTQIANASGTAETQIKVRGKYADGIAVEGVIRPQAGAAVTPRALGQAVVFQEGALLFSPLPNDNMKVTAAGVRAKLGEGELILVGDVDVRTKREADKGWVSRWNLAASASGVEVKLANGRVDATADLFLEGDEDSPKLKGRIEIVEGTFRHTFEMRNFVLQRFGGSARRREPLHVTLAPIGLSELELDVGIDVQSFRVRTAVTQLTLTGEIHGDFDLRGALRLRQSVRLPVLDGAIEAQEGVLDFPRARFEVQEMQLEFPTTADGHLNVVLHASARAEIPPGGAGANDTEFPIDLTLDGNLDEGIDLGLTATDPQREWSRVELLSLILFGIAPTESVDVNVAIRALAREAAAPLTRELEAAAMTALGVNLELDPTGLRWQIGRRLQFEGQTGLVGQLVATETSGGSGSLIEEARLRLLILDHLPVGKNLSFEARSGTTTSFGWRLSYRLFEE